MQAGEDYLDLDLIAQGSPEQLMAACQRRIEMAPDDPGAHLNLGSALRLSGRRREAVAAFQRALELQPGSLLGLYGLGATFLELGHVHAAVEVGRAAVARHPDSSLVHSGLGEALLRSRDLEEAKAVLRRSVALDSSLYLTRQYLGLAHLFSGEIDAAVECLRETVRLAPSCSLAHTDLSLSLLARGDYPEGWREYEWRWHGAGVTPGLQGFDQPAWDGSSLEGQTILLWSEQGFGDVLQFVRFASCVHDRGGDVWIFCSPRLSRLLATCRGVARVGSNLEEMRGFDLQLPLGSLARVLGITLENLPSAVPYLSPPAGCRAGGDPLGPRHGDELRVGVVWGVEAGHPNREVRSVPLPSLRGLAEIPGIELYSLQYGELAKELYRPDAPGLIDLSAVLDDFARTAAIVERLDLVITVDTAMAHLAGALGKPVWTLIPWESDWRWLRDRDDSPWYPTMRLFRQEREARWEPVIEKLISAVRALRGARAGLIPTTCDAMTA